MKKRDIHFSRRNSLCFIQQSYAVTFRLVTLMEIKKKVQENVMVTRVFPENKVHIMDFYFKPVLSTIDAITILS